MVRGRRDCVAGWAQGCARLLDRRPSSNVGKYPVGAPYDRTGWGEDDHRNGHGHGSDDGCPGERIARRHFGELRFHPDERRLLPRRVHGHPSTVTLAPTGATMSKLRAGRTRRGQRRKRHGGRRRAIDRGSGRQPGDAARSVSASAPGQRQRDRTSSESFDTQEAPALTPRDVPRCVHLDEGRATTTRSIHVHAPFGADVGTTPTSNSPAPFGEPEEARALQERVLGKRLLFTPNRTQRFDIRCVRENSAPTIGAPSRQLLFLGAQVPKEGRITAVAIEQLARAEETQLQHIAVVHQDRGRVRVDRLRKAGG